MAKQQGHPNIIGIEKGLGTLEARVLRTIAELTPPVSVRDVCDALQADGYFAYQGVLNSMNRLVRKHILSRQKQGQTFLYQLLIDPEEITTQVVENVLSHMGGKRDRIICRLLENDPALGAEEISELRKKLKEIATRIQR